jgi:hypothetical protein
MKRFTSSGMLPRKLIVEPMVLKLKEEKADMHLINRAPRKEEGNKNSATRKRERKEIIKGKQERVKDKRSKRKKLNPTSSYPSSSSCFYRNTRNRCSKQPTNCVHWGACLQEEGSLVRNVKGD